VSSLIWEICEPRGAPSGILAGFYSGHAKRLGASPEFKDHIVVDMIDKARSYYRTDKNGHFRDPKRYAEELVAFALERGVPSNRVMTWGSSRGATMALSVGLAVGAKCIAAFAPQISAMADISFAVRQNLPRGVGRVWKQREFYFAIHKSIKDGRMRQREVLPALMGLDLSCVVLGAEPPFPNTFLFMSGYHEQDGYGLDQFEAAASTRPIPLWIYRFAVPQHNVLAGHKDDYVPWVRSVWDGTPPKVSGTEVITYHVN